MPRVTVYGRRLEAELVARALVDHGVSPADLALAATELEWAQHAETPPDLALVGFPLVADLHSRVFAAPASLAILRESSDRKAALRAGATDVVGPDVSVQELMFLLGRMIRDLFQVPVDPSGAPPTTQAGACQVR